MRKIALIDWDGTIREGFTLLDWGDFLSAHLSRPAFPWAQRSKSLFDKFAAGELTHDQLANQSASLYAKFVKGRQHAEISELVLKYIATDREKLFSFAPSFFAALSSLQISPVVVSGCLGCILKQHLSHFNLREVFGLELQIDNSGIYTGRIKINPGSSATKRALASQFSSDGTEIPIALGNSASDLPLLEAATISVVVNNPHLKVSGFRVDLTGERTKTEETNEANTNE